ncbi:MAG: hypothetical protein ACJ70R_07675, partial [Nitrososphaera sp.]
SYYSVAVVLAIQFSCTVSAGGIGVVVTTAVALDPVAFVGDVVVILDADTSPSSPSAYPSSPATVTTPHMPG